MKPDLLPTRAEDMFCYAIYTASHVVNRAYTAHLARLGLTYPQYITLTLLWDRNGQKVTELAEKLRMGTNTVTPLVKRLESLGFVSRTRGKEDGRETLVTLTHQGRQLEKEAPDITECMIDSTTLSFTELQELQRLLEKLSTNMNGV